MRPEAVDQCLTEKAPVSGKILYVWVLMFGGVGVFSFLGWPPSDTPVTLAVLSQYLFGAGTLVAAGCLVVVLGVVRAEWRRPFVRLGELCLIGAAGMLCLLPWLQGLRSGVLEAIHVPEHGFWPGHHPLYGPVLEGTAAVVFGLAVAYILRKSWGLEEQLRRYDPDPEDTSSLEGILSAVAPTIRRYNLGGVAALVTGGVLLTVIGWDFGMNLVPHWNSTLFGSYYLATSVQGGAALLFVLGLLFRWSPRVGRLFEPHVFKQLGKLHVALALFFFYFHFAEFLTVWYSRIPAETAIMTARTTGRFPALFGAVVVLNVLVPLIYFSVPGLRSTRAGGGGVCAGILVGSSLERWLMFAPVKVGSDPATTLYSLAGGYRAALLFVSVAGIAATLWLLAVGPVAGWSLIRARWTTGQRRVGRVRVPTYSLLDPEELNADVRE